MLALLKFGWLLKYLPFLGVIPTVAMAILGFLGKFLYWLMADIADAFKEPWRFVVRTVCILVALGFGIYEGHKLVAYRVAQAQARELEWKTAHAQLLEDAKKADDENKEKLAAALKAKADAEAKIKAPPAAASSAEPKRVRVRTKGAARSKDSGAGSSLQWLLPVSGKSR